jgi:hypothetical protein
MELVGSFKVANIDEIIEVTEYSISHLLGRRNSR